MIQSTNLVDNLIGEREQREHLEWKSHKRCAFVTKGIHGRAFDVRVEIIDVPS